jgi:PIN domain nuclease of toxin-antitoxin system
MRCAWPASARLQSSQCGQAQVTKSFEQYIPDQLQLSRITPSTSISTTSRVTKLPFHHRDPFDRLIAAQALEEKLPIVSADPAFDKVKRLW